ncbi:MAG: glycoside hydrolase family 97 protein [Candidatus Cryptobacteroides sp.]|nr:glycoside hydrolase family 97 protein [Bacteroidales bacterium]MDY2773865.1 glycoside hydrolase family 97 protein [Candidatus Cryptobacteroides sp.]
MTFKRFIFLAAAISGAAFPTFAKDVNYRVTSPDGHISATVMVGEDIRYSVSRNEQTLIAPSTISMNLSDGTVFGQNDKVRKTVRTSFDERFSTVAYKKAEVRDNYNQILLNFKEFSLIFRAYDDGVAYRFVSNLDKKKTYEVISEQAEFNFGEDRQAFIPYVNSGAKTVEGQYFNSFENTYTVQNLSQWRKDRLAFLPLVVAADEGVKILITEADLTNYPGMHVIGTEGSNSLKGTFAPYPKVIEQGGHNRLQGMVMERENFIAKASGDEVFPWRVIMVSTSDSQLAVNDMVWKLSPKQDAGTDYGWVKPGKVAWDWWNDWNLYGVDFKAGINNETYKYYIDFASAHGIAYVILDEGWAVNLQADLFQVIPEIDIQELVDYGKERGVGIILWAGYWAFNRDMEKVCRHYSEMGVKGFKVDFMDRDDQLMVNFHARAAETAARYDLMLDFHGTYKPTGLSRRWPNVVNYEGVHGLEQMKWKPKECDQVTYDVTVPFIRMAAGPMDYTQGAMRNASKSNYRPVYNEPMSQGTRCRQLAEYVVFDSPLNMLCDSPSNYIAEAECTEFIAACPETWDESLGVNGEIGKYITIARRSGDAWYVGALTNWDERDITLDLSFLGEGEWSLDIFQDGPNAEKAARDYVHTTATVPADRKITAHLAPGGGWAAKITRK